MENDILSNIILPFGVNVFLVSWLNKHKKTISSDTTQTKSMAIGKHVQSAGRSN